MTTLLAHILWICVAFALTPVKSAKDDHRQDHLRASHFLKKASRLRDAPHFMEAKQSDFPRAYQSRNHQSRHVNGFRALERDEDDIFSGREEPKTEESKEPPCPGHNGKYLCDGKKNKISVCEYLEESDSFVTRCLKEERAQKHLKPKRTTRCGPCEEASLRVLDSLDSVNTPAEAMRVIDPDELRVMVDSVRALLSKKLRQMVTKEAVVKAFFPDPQATLTLPEFQEDGEKVDHRRDLVSSPSTLPFFDDLPDGCESSTVGLIASTIAVLQFWEIKSPHLSKAVAQQLIMDSHSSPMLVQLFGKIELLWFTGSEQALANHILSILGYLLRFFGIKAFWQAMKCNMPTGDIWLSGATIILSMMALCVTNGASSAVAIELEAIFVDEWVASGTDFLGVCFPESCDDGDLCTVDKSKYDESTNHELVCDHTPVTCSDGSSCDPADGICKLDDQLVPCVAVFDEDSSFNKQEDEWDSFRADYPDRPFCLLVPGREGKVLIPNSFLADGLTIVYHNITRDNGEDSKADDWVTKCRLDNYTSANVGWVGLFIDDSGSLKEEEVEASRNLFYRTLAAQDIQVHKVVNKDENWILPFMTTLVPEYR